MPKGGLLVIDDYYAWTGCRKAVDEYFSSKTGYVFETKAEKLHISKQVPLIGQSLDNTLVAFSLGERCMMSKGYRKVKASELPR
jgi:hypothetical protein